MEGRRESRSVRPDMNRPRTRAARVRVLVLPAAAANAAAPTVVEVVGGMRRRTLTGTGRNAATGRMSVVAIASRSVVVVDDSTSPAERGEESVVMVLGSRSGDARDGRDEEMCGDEPCSWRWHWYRHWCCQTT